MSRTAVALIVLLLAIIGLSVYFWFTVGTGSAEVDTRFASTLQCFTCEKCGHSFTLTMKETTRMLRDKGLIICPKCGEGGARNDVPLKQPTTRPAASLTAEQQTGSNAIADHDSSKARRTPEAPAADSH